LGGIRGGQRGGDLRHCLGEGGGGGRCGRVGGLRDGLADLGGQPGIGARQSSERWGITRGDGPLDLSRERGRQSLDWPGRCSLRARIALGERIDEGKNQTGGDAEDRECACEFHGQRVGQRAIQ